MEFTRLPDGQALPPIRMVRVYVKTDNPDGDWGEMAMAA
jgi:hypothetical protein